MESVAIVLRDFLVLMSGGQLVGGSCAVQWFPQLWEAKCAHPGGGFALVIFQKEWFLLNIDTFGLMRYHT